MSERVNNNQNSKEAEPQGSNNWVNEDPQQEPSGDLIAALEVFSSVDDPHY